MPLLVLKPGLILYICTCSFAYNDHKSKSLKRVPSNCTSHASIAHTLKPVFYDHLSFVTRNFSLEMNLYITTTGHLWPKSLEPKGGCKTKVPLHTVFISGLHQLYKDQLLCDVSLCVGSEEFPCHKVVLAAARYGCKSTFFV